MKKVEVHSRKSLFDDFFRIEEAMVSYERYNGEMMGPVRRLCFERGDSVAALLHNPARNTLILTEQFRYPAYEKGPGWLVEAVAGMLEAGENPEEALRREIQEEVGYRVAELTFIGCFYLSPGGSSERIWLYYAEVQEADRSGAGGGLAEEHEDIRMVEWPLERFWQALQEGEIQDAKTLVAGWWLRAHKQGTAQRSSIKDNE